MEDRGKQWQNSYQIIAAPGISQSILNGSHNTPNKTDKRDIPINIHWEGQYPLNNT